MISHHPTTEVLARFSEASLSTALGVAVSAHLSFCEACKARVMELEAGLAENLLGEIPVTSEDAGNGLDIGAMIETIVSRPPEYPFPARPDMRSEIRIGDITIGLPAVLGKLARNRKRWKHYRSGVSLAGARVDGMNKCDFLYMHAGGKIPVHTHGGTEVTLVLDGSFSDEDGHYEAGDFIFRDQSNTHSSTTDEGCLCFTVLDKPVIFREGLARLMNIYSRWQFRGA